MVAGLAFVAIELHVAKISVLVLAVYLAFLTSKNM
jgi:hypothetical protein